MTVGGRREKTREDETPTRYRQKRQIVVADRSTGLIEGGGQGCCRHSNGDSNGDGDGDGDDNDDGRVVGGSSCDVKTSSVSRSRYPWSSGRKWSRGTAASGVLMMRSRSWSR